MPGQDRDHPAAARSHRRQLAYHLGQPFSLIREPTEVLRYPVFAQWCGTERTADWHLRFRARTVVYGHLHIPRAIWHDGVLFEEVSLGYPSELKLHANRPRRVKQILPPEPFPSESAGGI